MPGGMHTAVQAPRSTRAARANLPASCRARRHLTASPPAVPHRPVLHASTSAAAHHHPAPAAAAPRTMLGRSAAASQPPAAASTSAQLPPDLQGPCTALAHELADAAAVVTRKYFRCALCAARGVALLLYVCAQAHIHGHALLYARMHART